MEISSCKNKAHLKVVPKFTPRARVTLHLASDLFFVSVRSQRRTLLLMTSPQIISGEKKETATESKEAVLTASSAFQVPGQTHVVHGSPKRRWGLTLVAF